MRRFVALSVLLLPLAHTATAQPSPSPTRARPHATAADVRLAPTPPMGFNTWNKFGCDVSDRLVREMADAIVSSGMKDAGYQYVVIDDCWQVGRDTSGRIVPDSVRFPSSIKPLADYVHGKGLKFGIYTDAGPRTCEGRPASYGHEDIDARTYAEWGVDYVKMDWCHADSLDAPTHYRKFRAALDKARRPIVLSICEWGRNNPWEWAPGVGQLWRITADIGDRWESIAWIINAGARLHEYSAPGQYNDADMLEVGNGGMTPDEYRAHFAMWAMMASPLMAGNDLRSMSADTREILTNPEVIAIDQDRLGIGGHPIIDRGYGMQVWLKPLADGSKAVALLNLRSDSVDAYVRWKDIGIANGPARVRDLWKRQDLGVHTDDGRDFATRFSAKVPPHGVVLLRISPSR
ncbi:MAG: glycoside hydrolase family 27 protein [Gemmatimonadaceae bacterium]